MSPPEEKICGYYVWYEGWEGIAAGCYPDVPSKLLRKSKTSLLVIEALDYDDWLLWMPKLFSNASISNAPSPF
jgi:hypothetical protein